MPESDTLAVHMDISQEAREHSEYFDELTEAERIEKVLAHHGVKGMKWGVRKSEDRVTKANKTTTKAPDAGVGTQSTSSKSGGGGAGGASAKEDEVDTKESEVDKDVDLPPGYTRKEFNAQRKMIDDFLASKGKGGGSGSDKAAGGKKKGGGGGGKKKGGSKGKKKSGKSDSSTAAKSSTSNAASAVAKASFKSSYPARKAITSILNRAPVLPKTISSGAQAIIDEINASVDARIKVAKTNSGLTHNDESTERIWTMTQKNTMILDDDPQEVARIQANGAEALKHVFESGDEEVLESLEGVLAHYGVLGMKWGVYKDGGRFNDKERVIGRNEAKALLRKTLVKGEKPGVMDGKGVTVSYLIASFNNETGVPDSSYIPSSKPRYSRKDLDDSLEKLSKKHYDEFTQDELAREIYKVGQFKELRLVEHDDTTDDIISVILSDPANLSDDELAHYGVLGMKWGVRKDDRSGRPQGAAKRKKAPLAKVKKMVTPSAKQQPPKAAQAPAASEQAKSSSTQMVETQQSSSSTVSRPMTDQELREAINRMQMEKTYKQLLAEQTPSAPKKADPVIKKLVSDAAKQSIGQILTKTATTVGTYAIAAAISGQNPALANALMKGVGDNALKKKAAEESTDDQPDASVSTNQNGSNSNKSSKSSNPAKKVLDTAMAGNKAHEQQLRDVRDQMSDATREIVEKMEALRNQ